MGRGQHPVWSLRRLVSECVWNSCDDTVQEVASCALVVESDLLQVEEACQERAGRRGVLVDECLEDCVAARQVVQPGRQDHVSDDGGRHAVGQVEIPVEFLWRDIGDEGRQELLACLEGEKRAELGLGVVFESIVQVCKVYWRIWNHGDGFLRADGEPADGAVVTPGDSAGNLEGSVKPGGDCGASIDFHWNPEESFFRL